MNDNGVLTAIYIALGALFGVMGRVGKWWKSDGAFNTKQALSDLASVPAIGMFAGGVCRYIDPYMDPFIAGLLAVCLGVIGIAAIETLIIKVFNRKADGL